MEEIKAKKLIKGNTIGIIAVSGRIREYERIESAKKYFEDKGFNVVVVLMWWYVLIYLTTSLPQLL